MDKLELIDDLENSADRVSNMVLEDYRNFYFPPEKDCEFNFEVVHGNYNSCLPGYYISRSSYPYNVLEYIISGDGFFIIDGQRYAIRPGMIFGFTAGTPHEYGNDKDSKQNLEKICIVFKVHSVPDKFKPDELLNRSFHIDEPLRMQNLFDEILGQGMKNTPFSRKIINRLVEVLIYILLETDFSSQPHSDSFYIFNKCRGAIDKISAVDISLNEIAEKCSVNYTYMIRLFKRHMGCTPKQYVDKLVVEKAVKMLFDSGKPIKEIAFELGFANQYYFSSYFKKHMHQSPSIFRQGVKSE